MQKPVSDSSGAGFAFSMQFRLHTIARQSKRALGAFLRILGISLTILLTSTLAYFLGSILANYY
jgi:uncharacterized PurR-regulated membrane protein YhhQ (DUF165 family)